MYLAMYIIQKITKTTKLYVHIENNIMPLSDTWLCATLGKEYPKPFEKTDRDGLSARVSAKGKITFQLRFWLDSKQCRLDVGTYPVMPLKQAREEIIKYKADIAKGHDPRVTKQLEKQANIEAITVEKLFYQWHESYCVKNKKGHFEIKRSFEIHLFPALGNFPVDKVTAAMWCDLFDKKAKESESITSRLLVNSKQMLSWGLRRQLIAANVLQAITAKADFNIVTKQIVLRAKRLLRKVRVQLRRLFASRATFHRGFHHPHRQRVRVQIIIHHCLAD